MEQSENSTQNMHDNGENMVENKQLNFQSQFQDQQSYLQELEESIVITVCDPIVKDGLKQYIVYTVKGYDRDGEFEILRRYSEFDLLRNALIQRWPGCYIPPLPPKKAVGNLENKFIELRRKFLENFCKYIGTMKHLYYSEEFRLFTRNNLTDFEKLLNQVPKQSFEDLIQKYHVNFKQLHKKEINTELVLKITSFIQYLKKSKQMLENFKEMSKNCADSRTQFNDQFNVFMNYLTPEYEKNCLSEYAGGDPSKIVFLGWESDHKIQDAVNQIKFSNKDEYQNAFQKLSDMLKMEILEIQAFQETINIRNYFEQLKEKAQQKQKDLQMELQKILAGKTTFKSFFQKGSKEESINNLEISIQNTQKDVDALIHISDIITVILGYIEIDRFKNDKTETYFQIIKYMTNEEIAYAKNMLEIWSRIQSNQNIMESELKDI